MEQGSTKTDADGTGLFAGDAWFDPIEAGIRDRVRGFIQELLKQELTAALGARPVRACGGRAEGLPERDARMAAPGQLRPGRDCGATGAHGCGGRHD